ncbi:MAG: oligosaccharide flippase family protein [Methylacidiphilales bacterium]|nr:oligosaccharide flippase family protein [Candidatus Methylacidiphilales bacterium]NJR15319.1 oligosaccharide flippase family protein [Calothrix sp. CSU_2_0]
MGRRKLLGNSVSLLINRLTQSITTFVLVAFTARLLGAYALGQYMLGFSYYFVFMTLISQGFKTLFTRELAREPEQTSTYLVSGSFLQLIASFIGYIALVIIVFTLPYSRDTSQICYIMGLTIIPFSLSNITEAIFQAQEKMYLIAISTVPIYILRVLLMVWAMSLNYDIQWISAILVISEVIILIVQWGLISQFVRYQLSLDWKFIWYTAKAARTFLFIEGISVFNSRVQIVILSLFGGEILVGFFGAITQLMQPFDIICNSLVLAFFPKMSQAMTQGKDKQRQLVEKIIEILLCVALPFIIGILFIGSDLLILIYKDPSFEQAATALKILGVSAIASSFIRPLSYLLVANGLERINLWDVSITTIIGGFFSIFLVSQYQLSGAVYSVIATQIISLIIYFYGVYSRLFTLQMWQIIYRPLLISLLMLGTFLALSNFSQNIMLTIFLASASYIVIIAIASIYSVGGLSVVRDKLLANKKV